MAKRLWNAFLALGISLLGVSFLLWRGVLSPSVEVVAVVQPNRHAVDVASVPSLVPSKPPPDHYLSASVPHCTVITVNGTKCCAPMWLLVGQRKCGTSSLYSVLTSHPDLKKATKKEIIYFGATYAKKKGDLTEYFKYFPDITKNISTGEGSPQYFNGHPDVPAQIRKEFPNIKLVITLREPGERAWSDFKMMTRAGWIKFDFGNMTREEAANNRACMAAGYPDFKAIKPCYRKIAKPGLLQMGHYAEALKWWFKFFPRDQFYIFRAEDYYHDSPTILNEITDFLGLRRFDFENKVGNFHRNRAPDPKNTMKPEDRAFLTEYFRPLNEELVNLLGPGMDFNGQLPLAADDPNNPDNPRLKVAAKPRPAHGDGQRHFLSIVL